MGKRGEGGIPPLSASGCLSRGLLRNRGVAAGDRLPSAYRTRAACFFHSGSLLASLGDRRLCARRR